MQIFAEPAPTKFDVRFAVAGIPVRVHPLFWATTILLSFNRQATLLSVALWLPCVFLSILVHELGHSLAIRHYGWRPRISMYGMGGLALWEESWGERRPMQQVAIAAAGPAAGFVLAAVVMGVTWRLGYGVQVLGWSLVEGQAFASEAARVAVHHLIVINLIWGWVNLAPVHPLDGSQIAYGLFYAGDVLHGRERSLKLSVWTGIAMALVGLIALDSVLVAVMFGWLAFSSHQVLRAQHEATAFEVPRFLRRMSKSWRAREQAKAARAAAERRRVIDAEVQASLHRVDAEDGEQVDPTIERAARDLLERLTQDIDRDRKKQRQADGEGGGGKS